MACDTCFDMVIETRLQETPAKGSRHLVAFDSDGTVFDSMEKKQHRCYFPRFIQYFQLKPIGALALEIWDEVNLHSALRGCNRYVALVKVCELLAASSAVRATAVTIPDLTSLKEWLSTERDHTLESLIRYYTGTTEDSTLPTVITWSKAVNHDIESHRFNRMFPTAREVLESLHPRADVAVVSYTPHHLLKKQWEEAGLFSLPDSLQGQDGNGKVSNLVSIARRYPDRRHRLYVGDSMVDLEAARIAGMHFFPIFPGQEERYWLELSAKGLPRFFAGHYDGLYEDQLVMRFVDNIAHNHNSGVGI
jgi:phosphoglycolate phosphatase-like HAD superfamily hydrolase